MAVVDVRRIIFFKRYQMAKISVAMLMPSATVMKVKDNSGMMSGVAAGKKIQYGIMGCAVGKANITRMVIVVPKAKNGQNTTLLSWIGSN